VAAFACFVSWGAVAARPAAEWQLAAFASSSGAGILIIRLVVSGAVKWRERAARCVMSCVLIGAAPFLGISVGKAVCSLTLAHDLNGYNAAAQWILGHRTPDSSHPVSLCFASLCRRSQMDERTSVQQGLEQDYAYRTNLV
jgi:hypothetical protein